MARRQERYGDNNDFYTYTVKNCIFERFPKAEVEYAFKCRSKGVNLLPFADRIQGKLNEHRGLSIPAHTISLLRSKRYLSQPYLDDLGHYRLNPDYIEVGEKDGHLDIRVRGPWYQTIDWEVPILEMVNEAYFEELDTPAVRAEGERRLTEKIEFMRHYMEHDRKRFPQHHDPVIVEMGTRRAFATDWHGHVIERLTTELPQLVTGTSNVHWGELHGVNLIGTMSHQGPMAMQALYPLHLSQKVWLTTWNDVFRGDLGYALSDTLGTKMFLRDFDLALAKVYDGPRQDSGDPFKWGREILDHYRTLGIDPYTKTGTWSDSLNAKKYFDIWESFAGEIRSVGGIGTWFSNDMGIEPLSIVVKMVKCNGLPVAKLSEDIAKAQCEDESFIAYLKHMVTDLM